eukprot:gene17312-biopygen4940
MVSITVFIPVLHKSNEDCPGDTKAQQREKESECSKALTLKATRWLRCQPNFDLAPQEPPRKFVPPTAPGAPSPKLVIRSARSAVNQERHLRVCFQPISANL